jgi:hypothetical protein
MLLLSSLLLLVLLLLFCCCCCCCCCTVIDVVDVFVFAVSAAMASRVRQGNSLFSLQHYNHAAQFLCSASMPLRRCMAVESLSLGNVPRNT